MTQVKICGLTDAENLGVAAQAGAHFAGFVFYPPSPRFVNLETARILLADLPDTLRSVGLFVDPTNHELQHILNTIQLDMIQLHGDETPARTAEIAALTNLPVIKAIRLRTAEDLRDVPAYETVAGWLLFDSKIEKAAPGGTGQCFDWSLLENRKFQKPWMLSGGLTPENVSEALKILKPDALDVSSGVEAARGIKDPAKIKAFLKSAKSAI
ncbi:MAG: phosphoribosylanthranilate isomerase [Alphaproteobacteria bacterium]|nr:phosphoribosylanthranilate isomerase [Alphaproteobacteria bacterium]